MNADENRLFEHCMTEVAKFDNGDRFVWTRNSTENYLLNTSKKPMIKYSIDGATRVELMHAFNSDGDGDNYELVFISAAPESTEKTLTDFQIKASKTNRIRCLNMLKYLGFHKYRPLLRNPKLANAFEIFYSSQDRDWEEKSLMTLQWQSESLMTYSSLTRAQRPLLSTSQNKGANSRYILVL